MSERSSKFVSRLIAIVVVLAGVGGLIAFGPQLAGRIRQSASTNGAHDDGHGEHGHAEGEHTHDHPGHSDATSIELSPQALKNIGYKPLTVTLTNYNKTLSLPGMVVERPGKSQITVSAPLGGVVTKIYVIEGEAIAAEAPLFDIRLTHEELVTAQGEYLKSAEQLEVINREINRLQSIAEGVIAGKRIIEQEYEKTKIEASLRAQREALMLHGLSEAQVDAILKKRELLKSATVHAPKHDDDCECKLDHLFHIQSLNVRTGGQVNAGDPLCVLADHCELYIEGTAFEEDAAQLRKAVAAGASVSANLLVRDQQEKPVEDLQFLYVSDRVDRESRALKFYVKLPNYIVLDRKDGAHRFLQWRFKPGQRVELSVPVDKWEGRIVVPADAVTSDGAENFVYRQNGKHFDRVPVHVEYRDKRSAILANDGALFPGDVIAGNGAFQIHLAVKNKSGGGIDPHAGHNH
jgi:membrane fusion protein, heavy metal efflux system